MSSDEVFDKVDEQDNVIGSTNKQTAHQEGHVHRVVAVYLFLPNGDLCVQEHLKGGKFDHSVGGHVKAGESYDVAAAREASEELGLDAPLTHIGTFYSDETYTGSNYRHMFGLYSAVAPDDWEFKPNEEVVSVQYMPLADVVDQMNRDPSKFTPGFLNTMEYYLEATGSALRLDLASYKHLA